MPLNVRRLYISLLFAAIGFAAEASSQTVPPPTASPSPVAQTQTAAPIVKSPTAAEVMRERISKAKAFIAVRNYNAANYELETLRRESADPAVLSVVNVLLMNSYLEQGDYKRAQDFLNQSYNIQKTTKPGAAANYFAVASQIVKGARNRVERYRALGLNPSDRTLPLEAVNDLEKMRETLEIVVTQSKEISKDKAKSPDAMALMEEATTSRSMIARDDYDARRWKDEVADTREELASSRTVVLSAVNEAPSSPAGTPPETNAAANQPANIANAVFKQPAADAAKPDDNTIAANSKPSLPAQEPKKETPTLQLPAKTDEPRIRVVGIKPVTGSPGQAMQQPADVPAGDPTASGSGPLAVGSLVSYATRQTQPVYPAAARSMRATGVVKVEVTIDEDGNVAKVQNATGPYLLQDAAKDAIRKWRFKPFTRDGQAVKATGFVNFNFAL